jgi:hypothetical protein
VCAKFSIPAPFVEELWTMISFRARLSGTLNREAADSNARIGGKFLLTHVDAHGFLSCRRT